MSMIARRRAANATGPSTQRPALSGPRCVSAALIASRAARSAPSRAAIPQMPHISDLAAHYAPHDHRERLDQDGGVQPGRAVGDVLEVVRQLLLPGHLGREPQLGEPGHPRAYDEA